MQVSFRFSVLLTVLLLLSTTAKAWIQVGEGSQFSYYPFPAQYSMNAHTQFLLDASMINDAGADFIEFIEFRVQSVGQPLNSVEIHLMNLPAGAQLVDGTFEPIENLTLFGSYTDVDFSDNLAGWYRFEENRFIGDFQYTGGALLVDICIQTDLGSDNHVYGRTQLDHARLLENDCDILGGQIGDFVPIVRIQGLQRELAGGTWYSGQEITIDEDLRLPAGSSLVIQPGVTVRFSGPFSLLIHGQLTASGQQGLPIIFDAVSLLSGWHGLHFEDNLVAPLIEHCVFRNFNDHTEFLMDGKACVTALGCDSLILRDVLFEDCFGSRVTCVKAVVTRLVMERVDLNNCSLGYLGNPLCLISGTSVNGHRIEELDAYESGSEWPVMHLYAEDLIEVTGSKLPIAYDTDSDLESTEMLLLAGNTFFRVNQLTAGQFALDAPTVIAANNLLIGTGMIPHFELSAASNALLLNNMYEGDSLWSGGNLITDQSLQVAPQLAPFGLDPTADSPMIDAGHAFYSPRDPDMTPPDVGAVYYDQSRPVLNHLADVPSDQGHQLQLVWNAGSMDVAELGEYGFYSVWREDSLFAATTRRQAIADPFDLYHIAEEAREGLYYERDGSVWSYVGTVPALRQASYGMVAPTLMDSTSVAANATSFKVVWHSTNHASEGEAAAASSVDNIPPNPVAALAASSLNGEVSLDWDEVTEGSLNGNSYPERGQVIYHVYHGSTPDFPCDAEHYLASTPDPALVLGQPEAGTMGFFKVVADDDPGALMVR
jgi:hypothetical protein